MVFGTILIFGGIFCMLLAGWLSYNRNTELNVVFWKKCIYALGAAFFGIFYLIFYIFTEADHTHISL